MDGQIDTRIDRWMDVFSSLQYKIMFSLCGLLKKPYLVTVTLAEAFETFTDLFRLSGMKSVSVRVITVNGAVLPC